MGRKSNKLPFAKSRNSVIFLIISATILLLVIVNGGMGDRTSILNGGLDSDQIRREGHQLYNAHCLNCHGVNGRGSSFGPPLVHAYYGPSKLSDQAFMQAVLYGLEAKRWDLGPMKPIKGISQVQIAQILAYVRAQQSEADIR